MIAGVRGKELDDARSLGVSDVLAIDDDKAIEKFRLVDAIADTVGGKVAAKLIAKVKQSGSFGYTAVLPESAAAQNPTVKIARVSTQPDPSKVREFADDVRDGNSFCPSVAECRYVMRLRHMYWGKKAALEDPSAGVARGVTSAALRGLRYRQFRLRLGQTEREVVGAKKRALSAAGRAAIAKAAKKRWAKVRKQAKNVAS